MLQLQFIKNNRERVLAGLAVRSFPNPELIDKILELDQVRRTTQQNLDQLRSESNAASKNIGQLYKEGKGEEAQKLQEKMAAAKQELKTLEEQLRTTEKDLDESLILIPNIPHPSVPTGTTEADNEVYQDWSAALPQLGEEALPHWELAEKYQLIDFKLGVKITGAGFPLYKGQGARLQRALIAFFLDQAHEAGYLEIIPPHLVNAASAYGTGQLPDKDGQMYYTGQVKMVNGAEKLVDDFYLIPTAEVPVTNMYRDVIVPESELPIKLTGYTPCFRREAGSYGKDVRGLNRVHQFDKVEVVQIQHPDKSYDTLQEMVAHVEGLLKKLQLPYRILRLCGGDLGFTSALTFDFEVYSAAQQKWLEVSSVSNFETYQTNRMKLRFRNANNKPQLAHTLNGSALALARIVAALLENNQTADGILIPEVLQPYTRFEKITG